MSSILFELDGPIARIKLNRPQARNALNPETCAELLEIARSVETNEKVRCLIWGAFGDHFAGGADVTNFAEYIARSDVNLRSIFESNVVRDANQLCQCIERMPFPVIGSLRGAVAGGPLGQVLGSDFIVASETAYFFPAHIAVGFSPDGGLSYHLNRLVGSRLAKKILMLGERINAKEAERIGLVDQVVHDNELDAATEALAQRLIAQPRVAIRNIKRLINAAQTNNLTEQLQLEAETLSECAETADFREGVRAFQEKRKPRFNQA